MNTTETKPTAKQSRVLDYMTQYIEQLEAEGKVRTARNIMTSKRRFAAYLQEQLGKKDVSFKKLDREKIVGYEQWLHGNGVGADTAANYIRHLKTAATAAQREGIAVGKGGAEDVFSGVFKGFHGKTERMPVSKETIKALQGLDIRESMIRMGKVQGKRFDDVLSHAEFARDLFLFCFCAQGMEFNSLAMLKKKDVQNGYVIYTRKQSRCEIRVKILPMMQEIMERYPSATDFLFPLITSTDGRTIIKEYDTAHNQYRKYLVLLGKMLGNVKLTASSARDAWTAVALRGNIPLRQLTAALGFSNESAAMRYLQSFRDPVDDIANNALIDSVLGQ